MNATLGILLPALLGQPVLPPGCAPGCGPVPFSGIPMMRPAPHDCPPAGPPAPLLAMKALLPDGTTINPIPGIAGAKHHANGAVFGFRPGYVYPLEIKVPGHESVYPVLEIRGSIIPRPGMRYMEVTAPLLITKGDLERVRAGGFLTKFVYLEDPNKAIPESAKPDQPIELTTDTADRAEDEARANGRIVAVIRLGDRIPTAEDLSRLTVANTVLLPGDGKLGTPSVLPPAPCTAVPLFDPIAGPKPLNDECFVNGGDSKAKLGIGFGGKVGGLDPTDVVGEYTLNGQKKVVTTNTVCLCAPRFIVRKAEVNPQGFDNRTRTGQIHQVVTRDVFTQRAFTENAIAREKTLSLVGKDRPSATVQVVSLASLGALSKPQGFAMDQGIRVVAAFQEPEELTNLIDLTLRKSVTPNGAVEQGTIVTITIRYANHSRRPITDLVISDSLSGRLEYVAGSAAADRPSNITTAPNDAGSVIVRFDLPGTIQPGTTGLVQFKAKVR